MPSSGKHHCESHALDHTLTVMNMRLKLVFCQISKNSVCGSYGESNSDPTAEVECPHPGLIGENSKLLFLQLTLKLGQIA